MMFSMIQVFGRNHKASVTCQLLFRLDGKENVLIVKVLYLPLTATGLVHSMSPYYDIYMLKILC